MSEALAMQRGELAVTSDQVAIARNTVAKGLNDDEFSVFLYNCQRQGIHPLDGLLIPISRNDNEAGGKRLTFVTTVDLLRSRAAETNDYAGSEDPKFEYIAGAENPQSATVTVWKIVQGMRCEFTATARWAEYYPGEKQGFMWRNKPHVMLGKCAEGLALRKAFPKQLAGLYLEEELQKEPVKKVAAPKKPVGDVMCSECRAINGHLPSCPTRKKADAAPQATPEKPKQAAPTQEVIPPGASPESLHWLVQINAVDKRTRTKGKVTQEYRILSGINAEGQPITLYAWDTKHYEQLDAIKPKTNCVFAVKASVSGDKTYYSVEGIVEISGMQPVEEELEF